MPRRGEAVFIRHWVPTPLLIIRAAFVDFVKDGAIDCMEWTDEDRNPKGVMAAVIRELWRAPWLQIGHEVGLSQVHACARRALVETPELVQGAYENLRGVFHEGWLERTASGWEGKIVEHAENGSLWATVDGCPGVFASGANPGELWDALIEAMVIYHADA